MNRMSAVIFFVSIAPFLLAASTLPATAVMRAGSPGDDLTRYNNAGAALDKGTVGQTKDGNVHFKSLIVFDVVSKIEELAQTPEATLKLPINWVKSADHVKDVSIYYVGAFPKANFTNSDLWKIVPTPSGTKVGEVSSSELAPIAPHNAQVFEFELTGKIPSGEVSAVNRYMVFRVESLPFESGGNGLLGVPNLPSNISLVIGKDDDEKDGSFMGGY